MLTECFGIEQPLVRRERGLLQRTRAKATAFTLACYTNRILDVEPLSLARYGV